MAHVTEQDRLETEFVDKFGLFNVLQMLQGICEAKAEHVRENWQDENLAKRWDDAGEILGTPMDSVKELNFDMKALHEPEKFKPRNPTS